MNPMPKYDYSRVPQHLLATLGRASADPNVDYAGESAAYEAVQAAALVPERTRAEVAEALLRRFEAALLPECTGSFTFSDAPASEIRALVNEARTAPRRG